METLNFESVKITIKLSGWNRSGQYGDFISLAYDSYKKKEEAPAKPAPPLDDSEIPF